MEAINRAAFSYLVKPYEMELLMLSIRRAIEKRLALEKNIRLATLVGSSSEAIISTDRAGLVTSWNEGAEAMFGHGPGDILGRPVSCLFPPESAPALRELGERVGSGESIKAFELVLQGKSGRPMHASLTMSPLRDASGAVVGAALVSHDISEQKALQAQVIRAQRLESLATLAAGMTHQFNNINAAVKGSLEVIARVTNLPAAAGRFAAEALKALQRSIDITERLGGITAAASAGLESIGLAEMVEALLASFEGRFEAQGVSIGVEVDPDARVMASRAMLGFVVESLLTNSLHALIDAPLPAITVRSKRAAELVGLEVVDTGCGIPAEGFAPRVYPPFHHKGRVGSAQFAPVPRQRRWLEPRCLPEHRDRRRRPDGGGKRAGGRIDLQGLAAGGTS